MNAEEKLLSWQTYWWIGRCRVGGYEQTARSQVEGLDGVNHGYC